MIARFQAFLRRLLGAASADHRHQSVVRPGPCDLGAKIVAGADGQILFINGSETNLIKANEALAAFIVRALRGWARPPGQNAAAISWASSPMDSSITTCSSSPAS